MSEPTDTSRSTFEWGFYVMGIWNEVGQYPYAFRRWINSLDESGLKKWHPKEWAVKFGGLQVGKIYTYNEVEGQEHHTLKSGDMVKLFRINPDSFTHVQVELMDDNRSYVGLVHVVCLMLDGGMNNKGVEW